MPDVAEVVASENKKPKLRFLVLDQNSVTNAAIGGPIGTVEIAGTIYKVRAANIKMLAEVQSMIGENPLMGWNPSQASIEHLQKISAMALNVEEKIVAEFGVTEYGKLMEVSVAFFLVAGLSGA